MSKPVKIILGFSMFLFISMILYRCNDIGKSENSPTFENNIDTVSFVEERPDPNTTLYNEIVSMNDLISSPDFTMGIYLNDLGLLKDGIDFYNDCANFVLRAKLSNVDSIINVSKKLQTNIIKLQTKNFPLMRKSYLDHIKDEMWRNDIDVSIEGKLKNTLNFTGGYFASNRNKEEFQTLQNEMLTLLRFKRVNYRFTKYDDEFTYYKVESLNDNEIIK